MRKFPPSLSFFLSFFHPFNSLAPARFWKHRHHGIRNRRDAAPSVQANNRILPNGPQQRTRALWILHQGVRSWARRDRANVGHPSSGVPLRREIASIESPQLKRGYLSTPLPTGCLASDQRHKFRCLDWAVTCTSISTSREHSVRAYLTHWISPRGLGSCFQDFVPFTPFTPFTPFIPFTPHLQLLPISTSSSPTPIGCNHYHFPPSTFHLLRTRPILACLSIDEESFA